MVLPLEGIGSEANAFLQMLDPIAVQVEEAPKLVNPM
jgi:hypothetical protein